MKAVHAAETVAGCRLRRCAFTPRTSGGEALSYGDNALSCGGEVLIVFVGSWHFQTLGEQLAR
ncbi:MAG: hypothetical protein IH987_06170 [Planctomycetes bacterium]|nr:hypothetical protein [Planctomycetota bacterium]